MYNYRITRLSYLAVFRLLFCAGVALGGLGGIALGLLERDTVGLFGGMFVGLVLGLCSSLAGMFYVYVFNTLAPIMGGLPIQVEKVVKEDDAAIIAPSAVVSNTAEVPSQDA